MDHHSGQSLQRHDSSNCHTLEHCPIQSYTMSYNNTLVSIYLFSHKCPVFNIFYNYLFSHECPDLSVQCSYETH